MATSPKKSIADFRAAHDKSFIVPNKIKAGLDALGPDGWEYELQFVKDIGVSVIDFSRFREQFEEFCVSVGVGTGTAKAKRIWAGSKALASKMRAMV